VTLDNIRSACSNTSKISAVGVEGGACPGVTAIGQPCGDQLVVVHTGLLSTEFRAKAPAFTIDVNIGCTRSFMTFEGRNRLVTGVCFV